MIEHFKLEHKSFLEKREFEFDFSEKNIHKIEYEYFCNFSFFDKLLKLKNFLLLDYDKAQLDLKESIELTVYFSYNDYEELFCYNILIEGRDIIYENLLYDNELVISKSYSELNVNLGSAWSVISKADPYYSYEKNVSILVQPLLIDIYNYLMNSLVIYDENDNNREKSLKLLERDSKIKSEFRRVFQFFWSNEIDEVTEDLRFLSSLDPTGTELSISERGSGFNRMFDILPFIIDNYLYKRILFIPYLGRSFHFLLTKSLINLCNKTGSKIVTYDYDL